MCIRDRKRTGEEIFEEAQKILAKRNVNRGVHQKGQKRNKFSRKYAFSCMIKDDASLKLDRDIYDKKNQELSEQLKKLQAEQLQLVELSKNQESIKTRIKEFRKNLNSGELLENFDRMVFESVVERIIIGGYNDEGVEDPLKITFVYLSLIHI